MEDRDLLDANFDKVTYGPTSDKLEWLAEMDAAWGTTDHIARGSRHSLRSQYCSGSNPWMGAEQEDMLINQQGSIKWR